VGGADDKSIAKQNKRSLWYDFEEQALLRKDAPCLWYRTTPAEQVTSYSWTQTYDHTNRYAQFLLENGVQPGDLVGTYLINSPEFMFTMMATWAVGSAPALINYNLGGAGLVHCLKVTGGKILIVDEDQACQERVQEMRTQIEELGMRIIILDAETKARILTHEPTRPDNKFRDGVTGEFPIFLFYTSGTTGLPKACALPTGRAYGLGLPRLRSTGLKPGDVWYDCMPMYHGTGCTVTVGCMITGVTLAIGRKFSVRNFWRDIHDSQANAFVYVGETARYLLAAPPSPLDKGHKVRAMYGNGMRPDVWLKFQERFNVPTVNEFFNSTEGMFVLLNVCRGPFHAAHVGHQGALERRRTHNLYIPVEIDHESGDQIWRDPKTGFARRKPYEEGGEIIVACKSEKDFGGYWNNPEATQKRFERDVFKKGDLYYRTGDALRRDRDGRWFFMDRLGDTFRWKSENVSTAEVAEVLGRFPGVVEANVYGVEVPAHDGRAGCAAIYIRPEERATFNYIGLLAHARKALPRYAVPVFLRLIDAPTPMHNNKQNKVPLRNEGVDLRKIAAGNAGPADVILWSKPGTGGYVPFTQNDWDAIAGGKVRL
jgi:acyl-CoA synthetase (AMP-forming)/AMP-acid ligase II